MSDQVPSAIGEAASTATSIDPVPPDDDEDVATAMLFLRIFKEYHHLIDKSCRDFWKVVTEKCHEAGIYVDKDSTNMYMDIWPSFVEHSKSNFQTDSQTEIDKIVMEIVVSRKPNSFVKKPPLTARQRAVANYHPPKIGIVEPEAQPMNGRVKKTPTKPPPITTRTPSRPPVRASMNPPDPPPANNNNNVRSGGNNVLVADPPPLPAALQPSALGFHENRSPTEALFALMQSIQTGLSMSSDYQSFLSTRPVARTITHSAPRPVRNSRPPAPVVEVQAPRAPVQPPPPPNPPPPPAPVLPSIQESLQSVLSDPPPPIERVISNEVPPPSNANPPTAPSSSLESNIPPVPDNITFLQYLAKATSFNLPFGYSPYGTAPAWMQLPPSPPNGTPYGLTPQQVHLEALRTSMLINPSAPLAGYSFGGCTTQKLSDVLGHSGAHNWNRALPTPSQIALEKLMVNRVTGAIDAHSDTSSVKTGDLLSGIGLSSNASRTSSSLFSTSSFDPFCFAQPSSSTFQAATDALKHKTPLEPAVSTVTEPLPRPIIVETSNPKSSKHQCDDNGKKKPREKSIPTTPKSKEKKLSKRKAVNAVDRDSVSRTPAKRRRQSPRPTPTPPREPTISGKAAAAKKRGPKPKKQQREPSMSPPTSSHFQVPVRQSMRLAIRMSLEGDRSDITTDESSTSLASKRRSRARSVAPRPYSSRRYGARSRTCAKLLVSTDDDE